MEDLKENDKPPFAINTESIQELHREWLVSENFDQIFSGNF